MNDLEARWIEALRSGKYKQGRGMLRNNDEFCCLGVLCDIYDNTQWVPYFETAYSYKPLESEYTLAYSLPNDIQEKLSYKCPDQGILSAMNDKNASFEEIADYLERELKS